MGTRGDGRAEESLARGWEHLSAGGRHRQRVGGRAGPAGSRVGGGHFLINNKAADRCALQAPQPPRPHPEGEGRPRRERGAGAGGPEPARVQAEAARGRAQGGRGTRSSPGAQRGSGTWMRVPRAEFSGPGALARRSSGGRTGVAPGALAVPSPALRRRREWAPGAQQAGASSPVPSPSPPSRRRGGPGPARRGRRRAVRQVPALTGCCGRAGCPGPRTGMRPSGRSSPSRTPRAPNNGRAGRCGCRGSQKKWEELPASSLFPAPEPGLLVLPEGSPFPKGWAGTLGQGLWAEGTKGLLSFLFTALKQGVEKAKVKTNEDKWPE